MGEVSTNGNFPPAARDNYDQSQNAEENKKRQEGEETTEVGNSTAEAVESSLSPANIDEDKMEIHVQVDKEGKIGADKCTTGRAKLKTKCDLYRETLPDSGGDRKHNKL